MCDRALAGSGCNTRMRQTEAKGGVRRNGGIPLRLSERATLTIRYRERLMFLKGRYEAVHVHAESTELSQVPWD
jgi:hypothetical protein